MDPLALKVAARFRVAESMGDPKELIRDFEQALDKLSLPADKLEQAKRVMKELVDEGHGDKGLNFTVVMTKPGWDDSYHLAIKALGFIEYYPIVHNPGHKLFLSILQSYVLPAPLRKKIEIASRAYLKNLRPRFKNRQGPARYLEYILLYEKVMGMWRDHLGYAKDALSRGKEHAAEGAGATKLNVGPFTVVNTGGFSEKVMEEIVDTVKKAVSHIQHAGFNEVCYGDIQVTNTIARGDWAAFYLVNKDEMFMRANAKSSPDFAVHTVIHELGHRYEHKFLKDSTAVDRLYRTIKMGDEDETYENLKFPEIGDKITVKGETFVVTKNDPYGLKVHLKLEDSFLTAKMPVAAFWASKGTPLQKKPGKGFVTPYAKTKPGENFAEMFAFYCRGKLPEEQVPLFESAIGKGAAARAASLIERVAARYAQKG